MIHHSATCPEQRIGPARFQPAPRRAGRLRPARVRTAAVRLILALTLLLAAVSAQAAKIRITVESPGGVEQYAYLSRPVGMAPDRPVVFVLPGMNRDAAEYRDQWHDLAMEHDFLLVVPEFRERDFPGPAGYDLGNVFDENGRRRPERAWAFAAIEPIFDDVRLRFGLSARGYALYGHSVGAQFVHRFLLFVPDARVTRAVAANAGWYTMPDFGVAFPHGLLDSGVSRDMLAKALQRPLTVLLGAEATDPEHVSLARTPEAMAQGPHLVARGQVFFDAGRAAARMLDVPFAWRLETVPEADHDNRLMAPAAIPYLLGATP